VNGFRPWKLSEDRTLIADTRLSILIPVDSLFDALLFSLQATTMTRHAIDSTPDKRIIISG
jgi:hypothetical protein